MNRRSLLLCLSLIAILTLVGSGLVFYLVTQSNIRSERRDPKVPIVLTASDKTPYGFRLPITNSTSETQRLTRFETSCPCVTVKTQEIVIAAGKTADIEVSIDLTHEVDLNKPAKLVIIITALNPTGVTHEVASFLLDVI